MFCNTSDVVMGEIMEVDPSQSFLQKLYESLLFIITGSVILYVSTYKVLSIHKKIITTPLAHLHYFLFYILKLK